MKTKNIIINSILSLILGLGLIYLVFKNIDISSFIEKLSEINYFWVYFSMFISIFEHVLRAYRWNLLMESPKNKFSTFITTNVVIVSYFFALFIPRFNDFVRCYLISKTNNIKISTSLGTVVSERIFDLISLFILILFLFFIEFEKFYSFIREYIFFNISIDGYTLIVILLILISLFFISKYLNNKSEYLGKKIQEFKSGMFSVKKIYRNKNFLVSTVLLWLIYFLMGYVILFAIDETSSLSLVAGLAVLVSGTLGMIVPVNAGIGAYHFLVASILVGYNIDYETGLFFATILHTSQIVCLAFLGLVSSLILFFKLRLNE
ncbi:MAG: lysylphosphatidylglycerol synthase transmembrane domain-containing protein [Bacteroidota bacterium]|nr:lysylphosphatidylglycerol synthase transmembrane domain-containing protein [Bacteroidota bacterium]